MSFLNKNRKFIFTKCQDTSVAKFTSEERRLVDSIVSSLSIKRIPDSDIIEEIRRRTNKDKISRQSLYNIRQRIKRESSKWYSQLREGEYEYIHEFKERINEIVDLQRRHYQIIDSNANNASIQQVSLAALHKLNVTLSNYYDVVPFLTATGQKQTGTGTGTGTGTEGETTRYARMDNIEGCQCRLNSGDTIRHNRCLYCLHVWCPKAIGQDWCPNPQCSHGIKGNEFNPWDPNYTWIECSCGMWFQKQEILNAHLSAYPHNNNVNNNNNVNDTSPPS